MTKLTLATKPSDNRRRCQIKLIRNTFSKNDCKNTNFITSLKLFLSFMLLLAQH